MGGWVGGCVACVRACVRGVRGVRACVRACVRAYDDKELIVAISELFGIETLASKQGPKWRERWCCI